MAVLGIDFGTSNSAAGVLKDGAPHLIEMAPGQTTLPTTFFFDFGTRETLLGQSANTALIEGRDGRFMRALKRVLGTSLMHEPRQILNERVTFVEIIARFLSHLKARAEAETGQVFTRAISGRPVHFHDDAAKDTQAERDLRACYLAAGFSEVSFLAEPEAAAIASGADAGIGLIVDIGGGTSDFSVFAPQTGQILANHGVRLGGTDFDRALSIAHVMPLLGKGSELRREFGPGRVPAPNAIFNDLATWEKIPFLYTMRTRRLAGEMAGLACAPECLARLVTVLDEELGHDIAFAVEAGKIAANSGDTGQIDLSVIEAELAAPLSVADLEASLAGFAAQIGDAAEETLKRAEIARDRVDLVVYVGGSSLISLVPSALQALLPNARHEFSEVFTAVADGLAIATGRA